MNKKFELNADTYWILYNKYKEYVVSLSIIGVCFLLVIFVIIPQIQNLSVIRQQEQEQKDKIEVIKKNERFLASLNVTDIDSKLQKVIGALPPQKDFIGILYALA